MSLVNCPSCNKKISDKAPACPHCDFSFNQNEENLARTKILKARAYRTKMYRYKMLGFATMALAVFGLVPMLWSYAQAIDYGFNVSITNHWGKYLMMAGFILYVFIRVLMFITKRKHRYPK